MTGAEAVSRAQGRRALEERNVWTRFVGLLNWACYGTRFILCAHEMVVAELLSVIKEMKG